MVISQMLQPMFDNQKSDELLGGNGFTGGFGEDAFKSVFVDAVAHQVSQHGGLGISAQVQAELIRIQSHPASDSVLPSA
jgi:peptidoglycan hydrolase FlgJ